jgi:hypothetical protein
MATSKITSTGTYDAYTCGRFGMGCSGGPAARAPSGGGSGFGWLTRASHWVWQHRVTIINYTALAICLTPGLDVAACAISQAVAYGFRAQARIQRYGFSRSLEANAADGLFTWMAIGTAGALAEGEQEGSTVGSSSTYVSSPGESFPIGGRFGLNVIGSQADLVQVAGNYLPGHDNIFFNSTP